MTLPNKFAFFPKTCDKCGRKFLWEEYSIYYRMMGIEQMSVKFIKCRKCKKEADNG